MPLMRSIKKVMVIGSGPIIIGQAAEFDYAGAQACRALKEEGLEVVLVNSNPATIMTDKTMADHIYIEPLTIETLKRIIKIEKPDSLLSTLGGQTGLTLSMKLAKSGFLDEMNVKLLGANPQTIDKAEDRQLFKDAMEKIDKPCIPSKVVNTVEDAIDFSKVIGYPLIIRPAFTLGGTGGGIAENEDELKEIAENGLRLSPITQILVEKSVSGWKEIEFEVVRDRKGNVITVCSMENIDPVGVHTGDSVVVAPTMTLADKEYQMLRSASLDIINELKVEGGCNCQFALNPNSYEYAVIEVNPRVSRSSALASKATGYPIAKVATKIAIGYTLDEIQNQVTKSTSACFEPALDYVVVKYPKWPFDKFIYAKRNLGTQMKATGEVMSIGVTFEEAMMKAIRGIELKMDTMSLKDYENLTKEEILIGLNRVDDRRLFMVYEALKKGIEVDKINEITKIDKWFLYKFLNLSNMEKRLKEDKLTQELYLEAKKMGFLDETIKKLSKDKIEKSIHAGFRMVDTCAGEFNAKTPYFYSSYTGENEALDFIKDDDKKRVLVLGSGPIRIGQGIEFDYCCVHCANSLKKLGYKSIICNNNPETVSTDFDTADRLYFDPVCEEDVMSIIETEKPYGVIVQFGGQTAIKLSETLNKHGIKILGTSQESIDAAEDREKFDEVLEKCKINRPKGDTVFTKDEALKSAQELGYPVLLRPSYVLGGQNMIIAYNDNDIDEYMDIITKSGIKNPVLVDKYMMGKEIEVDAICDGDDFLIPGIMEHIERAGVHSGDSISVYPAQTLSEGMIEKIVDYTKRLAKELKVIGLLNIQYVVYNDELYVIEVNPRSSRTVPYISKVTGVPMVELATAAIFGKKLKNSKYGVGLYKKSEYIAVKVPVFSFPKLKDVDTQLGPEMKSTGEVLGIAKTFEEAVIKGLIAAGYEMKNEDKKGVLITVKDTDKIEAIDIAQKFLDLGYKLYATQKTAAVFNKNMIPCSVVNKISGGKNNILDLLENKKVDYVISTSKKGRIPERDSVKLRRKTVELAIPCLTSLDTANALADSLLANKNIEDLELYDITKI